MICTKTKKNLCKDEKSIGYTDLFSTDKYTCAKKTNNVEYNFYKHVIENSLKIKDHIPKLKGVCNFNKTKYIQVENLKANMKKPIELDIKLGKHTVDFQNLKDQNMSWVSAIYKTSKIALRDKFDSRHIHHFGTSHVDYWGLKPNDMFDKFFGQNQKTKLRVRNKIKKIIGSLQELKNIRIIGMSLFIVYDFDKPENVKVKLIDFAHTMFVDKHHKSQDYVIHGLENIMTYL